MADRPDRPSRPRHPLRPGITLAATPLGNLGDAGERLRDALADADLIAAEDTRRTRALAAALGTPIRGRVVSNFDHNEDSRAGELVDAARAGAKVLVVTDAGMPVVSDPGLGVVAAAHAAGVPVTCLPGPSAVTMALALSGLGVGRFIFDGFAPRKAGPRRAWLESLRAERRAVCFFESPHRIAATLADAAEVLGADRRAAVARELTKAHEEVRRGVLGDLADWAAGGVRGEITVVLDGAGEAPAADPAELVAAVEGRAAAGVRLKQACREVLAAHPGAGVRPRELYEAVLAARSGGADDGPGEML
ncbi:16S rRNA (cytidine(1402)-2'-O)-methyltransferase [Corynebacterium sphenisci]|uniref:16S rRNA (cytidine(1402)-2'-O)-methyltransferase n=1 Tax=Corynebacterium sphenisci TaxID=191493 RepID=UPI0026DEF755|nr:16S rRNA (cytidine(1402)-2'-O)-methyltransferase [Corynebacterium sphenisci]MDO5732091.1 16S rRNA (cytidine(1402)-2'-O)-methyltransferase [Corynebacterium sphenisci]